VTLDIVARRYGQRPSAMMRVSDEYAAYCFDEAIAMRGLDAELKAMNDEPTTNTARKAGGKQAMSFGAGRLGGSFRGTVGEF
jgi:hypothetical protein